MEIEGAPHRFGTFIFKIRSCNPFNGGFQRTCNTCMKKGLHFKFTKTVISTQLWICEYLVITANRQICKFGSDTDQINYHQIWIWYLDGNFLVNKDTYSAAAFHKRHKTLNCKLCVKLKYTNHTLTTDK